MNLETVSQQNSSVNEQRIIYYSRFDIEDLENQLLEENSYQNRNIIRQVIRKKRKELKDNIKSDSKTENQSINDTNSGWKTLKYDENSKNNVDNIILSVNDSVELLWVMPFKLTNSIECSWHFNDQDLNISHGNRAYTHFDGKQAMIYLTEICNEDSGIYKITIHSQRLKRKFIKFQLTVNNNNNNNNNNKIREELSNILLIEKPEAEIEKATSVQGQSETIIKPRYGLNRNRFNRTKTMFGEELLSGMKISLQNENPSIKDVKEERRVSPERTNVFRKFNRCATSAKDIILTFCKLNTVEYYNYGVYVENLSTSWTDGLAFCALIHHFHPEAFDFSKLNKSNRRENFELAFDAANKYAEIYPLLDIDDMLIMERPDWRCIFTYVQCFYKTFRSHPKNKLKTVPVQ